MLGRPPIRTDDILIANILRNGGISVDSLIGGSKEVSGIIDAIKIRSSSILSLFSSGTKQELYKNFLRVWFSPAKHLPNTFLENIEKIFFGLKGREISKQHYDQMYGILKKASRKTFLRYIGDEEHKYLIAVVCNSTKDGFFVYPDNMKFVKDGIPYTLSIDGDFASIKKSEVD